MTTYAVHAQILTHAGDYHGSRSVPAFYLDSRVQGIVSREHAEKIAASIVNPLGVIPAGDVKVTAVPVDPARENRELDEHYAQTSAGVRAADQATCAQTGHSAHTRQECPVR